MGLTVESKNYSFDIGHGGFHSIREKVAELTSPDINEHYKRLREGMFLIGEGRKMFFDEYDHKISEISKKHNGKYDEILAFLYASDCKAKIPYQACEKIYEVIKDYDDDIYYGYIGRQDCARFRDFKAVVKDSADNKYDMEWF